ncbi:MAG: hypothetical protein WCV71_01680 [Patescibacteria group bacterium]
MEDQDPTNQSIEQEPIKQKNNLGMRIGVIVLLLILVGGGVYWWFQKKANEIKIKENQAPVVNEVSNKEDSEQENNIEDDYTLTENLMFMEICYLRDHPELIKYYPENLDEHTSIFTDTLSDDGQKDIDELCVDANEDGYNYFLSLLQIDEDMDGLNLYLERYYNSSDNNKDTDGDGFDDLVEIINGYDPNNLRTEYINNIHDQLAVLYESDELDIDKIIETCNLLLIDEYSKIDDQGRDSCLESASRSISDVTFCDKVNFSFDYLYEQCKDNMVFNKASTAEECLKVQDETLRTLCIHKEVKKAKSLEPCMILPEEFDSCVNPVFGDLESTDDCYKYKSNMTIDTFDSCLSAVAVSQNKATYCFGMNEQINQCIIAVAEFNNDTNQCANLYISPNASDYRFVYMDYNSCLKNILGEEASLEAVAIKGCQSLHVNDSPLDPGQANIFINYCFGTIANEYNKPEYCYLMSEDISPANSEPVICLSMIEK